MVSETSKEQVAGLIMKLDWEWLQKQGYNWFPGSLLSICLSFASADAWSMTDSLTPSVPLQSPVPQLSTAAPAEVPSVAELDVNSSAVNSDAEHQATSEETQLSQTEPAPQPTSNPASQELDISPEIIQNSPVLQRWRRQLPNVLNDIKNTPSFRTRLRLGYSQFPSTDQAGGFNLGVEDILIGRTGLTLSGDYQTTFNGEREALGAEMRYYLRPLGSYFNVAPVVGYRHLETERYSTDGVNLGAKVLLVLSRGGAADISLAHSWVAPGTDHEVGLTTFSAGYAFTRNLRLSTDIQKQNSRERKDSRVGIVLEWMP